MVPKNRRIKYGCAAQPPNHVPLPAARASLGFQYTHSSYQAFRLVHRDLKEPVNGRQLVAWNTPMDTKNLARLRVQASQAFFGFSKRVYAR